MRNQFIIFIVKSAILVLLASLLGCSTPTFTTRVLDKTYKGKFSELEVLLVFPGDKQALSRSRITTPQWYKKVGERMERNFQHNGIQLSTKIVKTIRSAESALTSRSNNIHTLVLYPKGVSFRGSSVFIGMEVILFTPNQKKSVWKAVSMISSYKAADQLSLKILNDLSNFNLVTLSHEHVETVSGLKNETFGGVLTR